MRACFDKNGFLLWLFKGDREVEHEPGQTVLEVPDDTDPNAVFMSDGELVERHRVELMIARTMLTGSEDSLMLEGLPDPAWLSIDGKRRRITGGSYHITRAMRLELVGPHCSNAIDITYQTFAQAADAVRAERDARLAACDWTQVPDAPVDREAWVVYRQALRDLPAEQTRVLLDDVVWPTPPGKKEA